VLLIQHPILALVFKQKLCRSLARWLGSVWFFCFFVFLLSSSCLVSSSFNGVWQFKFVCCPQVPEISSVAHQLSCFGVGFLLCWITGVLFLWLTPFLWGKVSDPSASPMLSACCDGLLIIFQFCSVLWLWVLLTGSGDELCWLLPGLFQAAAYHPPTVGPLPFQPLFTESSCGDQLLAPNPFSSVLSATPPLCCVLVFSSLFVFSCCVCVCVCGSGVSLPRVYAGLSQEWLGEYCMTLGAHPFGLPNVFQTGLELASGGGRSPPVFSV
jgi:hypothetical protein